MFSWYITLNSYKIGLEEHVPSFGNQCPFLYMIPSLTKFWKGVNTPASLKTISVCSDDLSVPTIHKALNIVPEEALFPWDNEVQEWGYCSFFSILFFTFPVTVHGRNWKWLNWKYWIVGQVPWRWCVDLPPHTPFRCRYQHLTASIISSESDPQHSFQVEVILNGYNRKQGRLNVDIVHFRH